jgi:hypothetical protein
MFVTPNWIVEAFNVLKDFRLGRLPCFVNPLFDFFTLQVTEERFGHRILPAITPSAHARTQTVFLAPADLLPTSRTKVMEQSPLISENSGYETIQIYR